MKVLHRRCAELDVHKDKVVACVRVVKRSKGRYETRYFATTTRSLLGARGWGAGERVHPRRNGGDRRLLEASLTRAGGTRRAGLGERGPHQERAPRAIIGGEADPEKLAELGSKRLRCSHGPCWSRRYATASERHRFMLEQHLRMIEELERSIRKFDQRIEVVLEPFRDDIERLTAIPGVSTTAAQVILAEIGADMSKFPTVGHLLSWAGLCPRLDESAGKRRTTPVRKGAPWLKTVLVQCAWAASRVREPYLRAQLLRLKARRGPKKAVVAVAASILTAAYHILRDKAEYRDLGPDHFVRRASARVAQRLARRIRELGYEVQIQNAA